ncbi:ATP-binding protein [Amycolatopsis balhimycina DSM 5908]|uniref:ATP-binding protein n=1 Tax=Amycolatopsis balhimycina DSM 5908 TaxID=1081091 RepID=A0A428WHW8_AMYBA|nr:ATP-binding protein [Amycolatopsis balhimycina]RSM42684.1 ATP-binding protein [Amycolatopsis balhimycina DSM 5908]
MEASPKGVLDADRWHEEATRKTTLAIVAKLQPAGVLFQFLGSFISAMVDPYAGPVARNIVLGLSLAHLPLAALFLKRPSPFALGRRWLWLPCLQSLLLPAVAAFLTATDRYGVGACTPLCNYAAPTITFLTMYVQVIPLALAARVVVETLIVVVPVAQPLVLLLLMTDHPTAENLIAVGAGQLQLVVGYVIGRAAVAVCRVAVGGQTETLQRSYDEFFNFLHSHVKAGLAAVRAEQPAIPAMLEKLEELEQAVSDRRIDMLFIRDQIPLAVVISERTRTFTGRLKIVESPRVGALTVVRPIGALISRALGDLLKNVVVHGGDTVRIRCSVHDFTSVTVEVVDNGPGFAAAVLDDPAKSLHRLRADARRLGGDLERYTDDGETGMRLSLPLR